ncbi:MAG TPA: DUF2249 domain-containing protein [Bacteroidetes bacterium]|nr:DUF2249 domain-containing protein [Bacteroidota bacterium]
MKINAQTKISDIIKANKDVIDVIATINKHFKKLKNPILRKVLAPRVTVADAAKIGGIDIDILLDRLSSVGFEVERSEKEKSNKKNPKENIDNFSGKEIIELDARIDLEKGIDPFKSIMSAIKKLPKGKVLKIINTFEPLPLIKILSEKGYAFKVERENNLVYTYFTKIQGKPKKDDLPAEIIEDDKELFDKVLDSYKGKLKEIDVRDLEMPLPMVTILQEIEDLPEGFALYVHHKRIPQFLLKELQERGYNLVGKKLDEANTKLIIYKK